MRVIADDVMLSGSRLTYLQQLHERLRRILTSKLHAIYVSGSLALADYRPGTSDLDVLAVIN